MSTVEEIAEKIGADNLRRAEEAAAQFPHLKVSCARAKGGTAYAAFHDSQTGWGFTLNFVSVGSADALVHHVHAFIEFTGPADRASEAVAQFKKIVGDGPSDT